MRTSHQAHDRHGTVVPETPLRMLITNYPDLAEVVFNNCIVKRQCKDTEDPSCSPKNTLCMNYEFIDDAFFINGKDNLFKYCNVNDRGDCDMFKKAYNGNAKVVMDNHPLMIMAREEQRVMKISLKACD